MSKSIKTEPVVYTKDFGEYSNSEDNFVAGQEITVTITLNEYRNLIKANSESKAREANRDKWEAQTRVEELEKEVEELEKELGQLKSYIYTDPTNSVKTDVTGENE